MAKKLVVNLSTKNSSEPNQTQADIDQVKIDKDNADADKIVKATAKIAKKLIKNKYLDTLTADQLEGLIAILEDGNVD